MDRVRNLELVHDVAQLLHLTVLSSSAASLLMLEISRAPCGSGGGRETDSFFSLFSLHDLAMTLTCQK